MPDKKSIIMFKYRKRIYISIDFSVKDISKPPGKYFF